MNTAYISAFSALAGSAIGAFASLATTWLTQNFQDRTQRRAQESGRQERLYGDFIDEASKRYADALSNNLSDPSKLVPLYAIFGKLRLFASDATIDAAYKVLDAIIETYFQPPADFQVLSIERGHRLDFLAPFIRSCRDDLRG